MKVDKVNITIDDICIWHKDAIDEVKRNPDLKKLKYGFDRVDCYRCPGYSPLCQFYRFSGDTDN